jgi:hypothetical protein
LDSRLRGNDEAASDVQQGQRADAEAHGTHREHPVLQPLFAGEQGDRGERDGDLKRGGLGGLWLRCRLTQPQASYLGKPLALFLTQS